MLFGHFIMMNYSLGDLELKNRLTADKNKLTVLKKNLFHYISKFSVVSEKIKRFRTIASNLLPWLEEVTLSAAEIKVETYVHATLVETHKKLKVVTSDNAV